MTEKDMKEIMAKASSLILEELSNFGADEVAEFDISMKYYNQEASIKNK